MASVFLSYDRDDAATAKNIAGALEKAGHSVWWDLHVRGGAQFSKVIEEALKASAAVVVLWSQNSIESAWVRDEAAAGCDSGRLVPVTIDGTEPPLGFRQFQTIDLSGRKGRGWSKHFAELLQAIGHLEPGSEPSPPAPPRSTAPSRSWKRIPMPILMVVIASVPLLVTGFLGWRLMERSSHIPVVAVAPADPSPTASALARDLLVKLGSLRSARTDLVRLTAGSDNRSSASDFIFEASATTDGDGTLALLSGKNRAVLWSKDFAAEGGGRMALEQSMAYTAGQVLDCALQANPPEARPNEQILKLFLNGCALFGDRYRSDPASVVPIFSQVVAAAPRFQPAWSKMLLAESQNARGQRAFYDRFVPGDLPAHIRQVRKLNPRMAELYVAETGLLPLSDVSQRYRLAEQAVHLSPDNPDVLVSHSEILSFIGRYGDAIEEARRAVEIDPLSPGFRSSLIQTLAYGGQLSAAEEELRRAQQLWPGSHTIDDARFRLNSRYGDPEVALKMLQNPELRQFYMTPDMGAYVQARANPTEANIQRAIAAAASPQLPERRRVVQLAQIFSEFGRDEELYRLLSSLSPEQFRLVSGVIFRPSFKKFRQDRRFIQLAARAGLVEFWRESGKWPDFCFEPELPYDCKQEASKLK